MVYDIAIVGAGPGGYVAAIRAAQLGAKVALIEKDHLGGTCLNWGCIPSKAILASVDRYKEAKKFSKFGLNIDNLSYDYKVISERKWKIVETLRKGLKQLIKTNRIDFIAGEACIESNNQLKIINNEEPETFIDFKNLILASGSRPISLPSLEIDHDFILDTNDVLALDEIPDEVLIVGSGASGIEWTRIFEGLDKKVVLVEVASAFAPMFDVCISEGIERILKRNRVKFYKNTCIEKVENKKVTLDNGDEFTPGFVFLAAGRAPNIEIKGIEKLALEANGKFIKVDNNLQTNVKNIYAIGDITGILPLAHVASHQGFEVVEHILQSKELDINYFNVPRIIYGKPEIACVGHNERELQEKGIPYKVSKFPFSAVGKSLIEDELEGFVKVIGYENKILGVHTIGAQAAEIIQQAAIAMKNNITVEELKETVFAHPSYSEAIHESVLGLSEEFLHLPPKVTLPG